MNYTLILFNNDDYEVLIESKESAVKWITDWKVDNYKTKRDYGTYEVSFIRWDLLIDGLDRDRCNEGDEYLFDEVEYEAELKAKDKIKELEDAAIKRKQELEVQQKLTKESLERVQYQALRAKFDPDFKV